MDGRNGTLVSGECPRADQNHRLMLLPCWPHHDRSERCRFVHQQHHGSEYLKLIDDAEISQFMLTAALHRRCTVLDVANIWVTSFFGNLAGMLFFMAIITGCRKS